MSFDPLGNWAIPHFDRASFRVEGFLLLGFYVVALALVLLQRRLEFASLSKRKLILFGLLAVVVVPANNLLWLRFPNESILPPPGVPASAPYPSVPIFGSTIVVLGGVLVGPGAGLLLGFLAGLVRGALDSFRVFAPVELAAYGFIVGLLVAQRYRGRGWRFLRQPLVAGLIGAGTRWVLLWAGVYAATQGSSLSALDYTRSLLGASVGAVVVDGLLGGAVVQLVAPTIPRGMLAVTTSSTPPHTRSINRQLLTVFLPLTFVMILGMFFAVTTAAVKEATRQVVSGMIRSAEDAADMLPLMFNSGQEQLKRIAVSEPLRGEDPQVGQDTLASNLRVGLFGPYFTQLILVDGEGTTLYSYPQGDVAPELSAEELTLLQRALDFGSPERSHVFDMGEGRVLSFIAPVEGKDGQRASALVGRSRVDTNPMVRDILSTLEGAEGAAPGFVVDDRGLVAFHPDDPMLLPGSVDLECREIAGLSQELRNLVRGRACHDLAPDGTQRLVYYLPVAGMRDWAVVITHPYREVLDLATRISRPVILVLLAVIGVLVVIGSVVTGRLTHRLKLLATAAHDIAHGQLDSQVSLTGEDEVGQLGRAFEQMRLSLKDRLDDLSLLLRVSQEVSSHLDMSKGVSTILEGALEATDARFARLIMLDERGDPQFVIPHGNGSSLVTSLDRAMAQLGRRGEPVRIENIARARGLIEPSLVGPDIKALIAVPMRSQDHDVGVMWLGYDSVHQFSAAEIDFLSTLTSQAAVAVENAKLFQTIEGERRRLTAILQSTSDAVIVTDHANRVLLFNPAAAHLFGADTRSVDGMPIAQALHQETVLRLFTAPMEDGVPLTDEVPLPDGRTFYASASIIVSGDGQTIGRVAVLRDISYLKELDEMKSEFVATVSHDLRSPLTFMRGYATMIPMVGDVSPKQRRYVERIIGGIGQMTELIEDLLDLGRFEAGVGLQTEPCRLDDIIVTVVDTMRAQAKAGGVNLRLDRTEDITIVIGDASALRRVISNLVDNALKYTPKGGSVKVGWVTRGRRVLISVADTGIGIAKVDQVRLFEKFSRIKRRETVNIKGSGLGLAIVKSIVELHTGRVWVESELNKGSTFYVDLPVDGPAGLDIAPTALSDG